MKPDNKKEDVALLFRRSFGRLSQILFPSYSYCYHCGLTWNVCVSHFTPYGENHHSCFPLCEWCWKKLTKDERLPYYERLVLEWQSQCPDDDYTETISQIRKSVMEGK